jgi:diguanylate cyclase (GGDEF)-like protein/PAS domain S-box-containing protein
MPQSTNSESRPVAADKQSREDRVQAALPTAGVYMFGASASGFADHTGILERLTGSDRPSFLRLLRAIVADHRRKLVSAMREARSTAGSAVCELPAVIDGDRDACFRTHLRYGEDQGEPRWDVILIDISAESERIERHKREEEHLRNIVEYNPQLPWIADPEGRVVDFTDRWLQSTGLSREQAMGEGWISSCHPDDVERVAKTITHVVTTGESFDVIARLLNEGEYRWMRARGYPRLDEDGAVICWYGYTEDVHEKVLIDQQIRWDAEHDGLTGLYNRSYFSASLEAALAGATANFRKVALLLIDLDNFKDVNDVLGHSAGDELLQQFSEFLSSNSPEGSVVARLGGDEFAILIDDVGDLAQAVRAGERLIESECVLHYGGRSTVYSASVGVGLFPDHGISANQLMKHTDLALYHAKSNGRSQVKVFEMGMLEEMHERLAMVNRARTAAKDNRILAYYQPKICLKTGKLAGFEALLRWQDDRGQIHTPDKIYAAFEEKGVADMLGKAIIGHVLNDMKSWRASGLDFCQVAINASPAEMRQTTFADNLIEAIESSGFASTDIEIEITEGVFLGANADTSRRSIDRMNDYGIPLALDDFGTGYASLSHLRNLPVSTVKVDRSFVTGIVGSDSDRAIVAAIITMANALGTRVVAEGIETEAQEQILKDLGCPVGQGFLFGRPVPSHDVAPLIENWAAYGHGNSNSSIVELPRKFHATR